MIEQELKDVIERNLPSQVGQALRERLAKADADARKVTESEERIRSLNKELVESAARIAHLSEALSKHADITTRIAQVEERERNAEISELKIKLEAEQRSKDFARDVALGLVRNVEYRHAINHTESHYKTIPVPNGSYTQQHTDTSSYSHETAQVAK